MSAPVAAYPGAVWDSSSVTRNSDRSINRGPDYETWDRLVSEVIAVQGEKIKTLTNDEASATMTVGEAVYIDANNGCKLAKGDSATTMPGYGIVVLGGVATATVLVKNEGDVILPTASWDAVTGDTGGLVAGKTYYVSDATSGHLTKTAVSTSSHVKQALGVAVNATTLTLSPNAIVQL